MANSKICPICGKEFSSNLLNKKYCSSECYAESKRQNAKLYYENHKILKNSKSHYEKHKLKLENDFIAQNYTKLSNEQLHKIRIKRQQEAFKLGISYGQYIARFGGEFIP